MTFSIWVNGKRKLGNLNLNGMKVKIKLTSDGTTTKKNTNFKKKMRNQLYDNDELFDIERTLVETIASSMDALNVDGTRKKVKEYFDSTLLPGY